MHVYRSHTCGELRQSHVGQTVRLSGWIHSKRDHGNLLFIDLRDHYGITQIVTDSDAPHFGVLEGARAESVITITGRVIQRVAETVNDKMDTGEIEVRVDEVAVQSAADVLPIQVNSDQDYPEDLRLKHRYLDLRRPEMQAKLKLRSDVIASLRRRMVDHGFMEFQTPILTASSPEGARDFLVPSRLHPGEFYALPQAPQQFKQLVMTSGFDRYFQIAPCFRDEDARADRSPGEFYQLDVEMAFVEQEDVFSVIEPVLHGVFEEFGNKTLPPMPFPRIPFREAMMKYGSDKPDLRNPLEIVDVTDVFSGSNFGIFAKNIDKGAVVRAVPAPNTGDRPRSFFDKMNDWARENGAPGMGYIIFSGGEGKGPIANNLDETRIAKLKELMNLGPDDGVFFACDKELPAAKLAGLARTKVGEDLDLIPDDTYRFCWIVDFPMYEFDETEGKVDFSHNPFSMPQGGLEALETQDPLDVLAYQYDIVCNGVELSSGAIRNHIPELMVKAFEIAGYDQETVETRFPALYNAFQFGAPPHGGIAPGVDRIVMLLADEPNIREVTLFPMNGQARDLLMGAPAFASERQLRDVHIRVAVPPKEKKD